MIRGYVSSDEDDSDDYDFGYFGPLAVEKSKPPLPEILSQENKNKLISALEESNKFNLFMKTVERGNISTLEELIADGVPVDCVDEQGWSALINACGKGNFEVVEFLLENGADPNKHRELITPLMTCCIYSLVEEELKLNCVRSLLEHGANVNAKDKFQTTALMQAVGSGYNTIITELLAVPNININAQDKEGWSAVFYALKNNDLKCVEKLVAAGIDLKLKDKYQRTVIDLALDKNLKDVAKALGYVEESPVVPSPKMTLEERFLNELPDSKGQGGFYLDAQEILNAFNQFNVKSISLPDLLNATEKDLYDIGVKLQAYRLKILTEGIHRYHLCPWKTSTMHQITPGGPIRLEDFVILTGSFAKHLTIANASLRYVSTRISSRQKEKPKKTKDKLLVMSLVSIYQCADHLEASLKKILKHIEQIKPEIRPDYIYPTKHTKNKKKWLNYYLWVGGLILGGSLILLTVVRKCSSVLEQIYSMSNLGFKSLLSICNIFHYTDVSDKLDNTSPFF